MRWATCQPSRHSPVIVRMRRQEIQFLQWWFLVYHVDRWAEHEDPIFDGLYKQSSIRKARLELQRPTRTSNNFKASIDADVEQARLKIGSASSRLITRNGNMDLAVQVYNATKLKYEQGLAVTRRYTPYKRNSKWRNRIITALCGDAIGPHRLPESKPVNFNRNFDKSILYADERYCRLASCSLWCWRPANQSGKDSHRKG